MKVEVTASSHQTILKKSDLLVKDDVHIAVTVALESFITYEVSLTISLEGNSGSHFLNFMKQTLVIKDFTDYYTQNHLE